MAGISAGEHLELYHRTTRARAEQVTRTGTWPATENGEDQVGVLASTHRDGQTGGFGDAIVALRIPPDLAVPVAEFSDGEEDYHLAAGTLRPEHVTLAWDTDYITSTNTHAEARVKTSITDVTESVLSAEPEQPQVDRDRDADDGIERSDSTGITPTTSPEPRVELAPEPSQVDLDLGEAVYRQAAARGGFTPGSVAAAEVTIEQAVTRQTASNSDRLHALADQVETARASRGPAPSGTSPAPPAPAAPPPPVEVARARAASAQIWHDTRDEYAPPAQSQRC